MDLSEPSCACIFSAFSAPDPPLRFEAGDAGAWPSGWNDSPGSPCSLPFRVKPLPPAALLSWWHQQREDVSKVDGAMVERAPHVRRTAIDWVGEACRTARAMTHRWIERRWVTAERSAFSKSPPSNSLAPTPHDLHQAHAAASLQLRSRRAATPFRRDSGGPHTECGLMRTSRLPSSKDWSSELDLTVSPTSTRLSARGAVKRSASRDAR